MPEIEWKPEYELGIAGVDHEHRELIELINTLCENLRNPGAEDSVALLGELYTNVTAHFALEEKLMRDLAYDGFHLHAHEHDNLLDVLRELMDDFEDGRALEIDAFVAKLDAWFSDHFRTQDARLHQMIDGADRAG